MDKRSARSIRNKSAPELLGARKSAKAVLDDEGEEEEDDSVLIEILKKEYEVAINCKKRRAVIDDPILRQLGYEIREVINRGKFSTFKRAIISEVDCVAKIVEKSQVPASCMKFYQNELNIIKSLFHRNILNYLIGIETQYRIYLVSNYAPNGNLKDFIAKTYYVPEDLALDYFIDIISGIGYCHSRRIAHCNISSNNILITTSYILKIADFKFAKKYYYDMEPLSTEYCGEYYYTAPEVMTCTPHNPFLADVWSMGVVLYEMLKGELPFRDPRQDRINMEEFRTKCNSFPQIRDISKLIMEGIFKPSNLRVSVNDIANFPWVGLKLMSMKYDARESKRHSAFPILMNK